MKADAAESLAKEPPDFRWFSVDRFISRCGGRICPAMCWNWWRAV